jgi:Bacteriophage translational regulator
MESIELFRGYGIPITLENDESFLKVRETLSRIGIASKKEKKLWQSCHILHKQGYYHILHFKELFLIDGRPSDLSENDLARRNTIALLLDDWGLLTIANKSLIESAVVDMSQIKVLSHKEKSEWEILAKYSIGTKKKIN